MTTLGAAAACSLVLAAAASAESIRASPQSSFDVRGFGARGDGITLDTDAINAAIGAAVAAGGGTVIFPAGHYLSFSIRLRSNVALYLDTGCVLAAADPDRDGGRYDAAEPNPWDAYQDFGHSHWHNSLLWGEGLENVTRPTGMPGSSWSRIR